MRQCQDLCHEADRPSLGTSVPVPRLTSFEPSGTGTRALGQLQQPEDRQDVRTLHMVHLKRLLHSMDPSLKMREVEWAVG